MTYFPFCPYIRYIYVVYTLAQITKKSSKNLFLIKKYVGVLIKHKGTFIHYQSTLLQQENWLYIFPGKIKSTQIYDIKTYYPESKRRFIPKQINFLPAAEFQLRQAETNHSAERAVRFDQGDALGNTVVRITRIFRRVPNPVEKLLHCRRGNMHTRIG